MINLGLCSEDHTLYKLLVSALKNDFHILLALDHAGINQLSVAGNCDVLILDLHSSQNTLQDRFRDAHHLVASHIPMVVMADDALREEASELVRQGAFGYCRRPPSIRSLRIMLHRAYENAAQQRQAHITAPQAKAADESGLLLGSSPQMQQVKKLIQRAASLHAPLLITGEKGSGKELIARTIHHEGPRRNQPFVTVPCDAIPEEQIEVALFGQTAGAFNSAAGEQAGYLEQTANGTLFLDEIGALDLLTQSKLARALQQMEFCRLGSSHSIPLRTQLIFATHQKLDRLVTEEKFRQDLFCCINIMQIQAPSLREHLEDIPCLAQHFLQHYGAIFQKPMEDIDAQAFALLQSHSWTGNVRELENVLQKAIIQAPGKIIRAEDLRPILAEADAENGENGDIVDISDYQAEGSFERQVRDYKVKLAIAAIEENHGNKTLAARSLCISRAYLHRLIRLAEPDQPPAIHHTGTA